MNYVVPVYLPVDTMFIGSGNLFTPYLSSLFIGSNLLLILSDAKL